VVTDAEGAKRLLQLKQFNYKDRMITMTPYLEGNALRDHQQKLGKRRIFLVSYPYSVRNQSEIEQS
jgi:hypothetical protein